MKYVNQPVRKTDAMSLVTGKPVYTDDLAPRDCLIVKILRSPHANAWVEDIKTGTAEKVAGIACILTYKDVPQKRFTLAGQTAPEMSPDDRLILDRHVRFVGDAVAIVAGETEEAVDKALKRIRVDYRVETPVLDIHKAKDNPILVHPEDDWKLKIPLGGDNKRNLCASAVEEHGNVDEVLAKCKYTVERTSYKSKPADYDGDFPHSLLYGSFRQTDRSVLNTDPIPCAKDRWKGTGHSCFQSTCDQAKDRWRLWCKADLCQ